MKLRITKTVRGFEPEEIEVEVLEGNWDAWRKEHGIMVWEYVPTPMNPKGYRGFISLTEFGALSSRERQILVCAALTLSRTSTEIIEV